MVAVGPVLGLVLWASSASAARQVAYSEDSGEFPFVYGSDYTERPTELTFQLRASPTAPVDVEWSITCYKGNRSVGRDFTHPSQTPPVFGTVPLTIERPDDCSWSGDASYTDFDQNGTLILQMFAEVRPFWITCAQPRWIKWGHLLAHDTGCGLAGRTARRAITQPPGQGSYVGSRGFDCVRSTPGRRVRLRCSRDEQELRFTGRPRFISEWMKATS